MNTVLRLLRVIGAMFLLTVYVSCSSEATTAPTDVVFVIDAIYTHGSTMSVQLHNPTERTYYYNQYYAACNLTYRDSAGRVFRIPPGTHCDLVLYTPILPGETATLFTWDLTECVRDEWGCVEEAPLPAGRYTIEGTFSDTPDYQDMTGSFATVSFDIIP